jgi:hypothetical protein
MNSMSLHSFIHFVILFFFLPLFVLSTLVWTFIFNCILLSVLLYVSHLLLILFASTFKASYCEIARFFIAPFGESFYAFAIDLSPDTLFNDTWCHSVELCLRNFGFCKYWRTYGQRETTLIFAVISFNPNKCTD